MFPPVDTKDPTAVASFVADKLQHMHPGASVAWLNKVFRNIEDLFTGRLPDYLAIDLHYHDLEHTLQATVCLSLLLDGRHRAGAQPQLGPRQIELALAAALLHDTGYLKLRSDVAGTGAKYTYHHVLRSCAFAAGYLPGVGGNEQEIEIVLNAIKCTGPTKEIGHLHFENPIGCVIGSAVGTADYLGQMAAQDYPNELEILYDEFREADEFVHVQPSNRTFKSASDLIERTPCFWQQFVRRKLEVDFQGMYRFLAHPYPDGPNRYLEAVEANIAEISRRIGCPSTAAQ
ncbi:MAG: hypothetical protein ACREH8_09070 [Opitutaceae bacterium]